MYLIEEAVTYILGWLLKELPSPYSIIISYLIVGIVTCSICQYGFIRILKWKKVKNPVKISLWLIGIIAFYFLADGIAFTVEKIKNPEFNK